MLVAAIGNGRVSRSAIILTHDLLVGQVALALALLLVHDGWLSAIDVAWLVRAAPLFLLASAASCLIFGLHRQVWTCTTIGELVPIAKAATVAIALFAGICIAARPALGVSPALLVIEWFVLVVGLSAARVVYPSLRARRARAASHAVVHDVPVLLYGCGPIASFFIQALRSMPETNLRVVGIIDDSLARRGRRLHRVPILGALRDLDRILAELATQGICPQSLLLAGAGDALLPEVRRAIEQCCAGRALELRYLPDMISLPQVVAAVKAAEKGAAPSRGYLQVRRAAEVVMSGAALLTLSPVVAAIALAVLGNLGSPVLSRQMRRGRYMRPFTLYKFRTMRRADADDDARISALGRFLRRSRLDGLPQLFNVLRGDMSFIGPRPLLPADLSDAPAERVTVRPGLTGWAEVNGGHKLAPIERAALDRWYLRNASVTVDARILWRALRITLGGEGADGSEFEHMATARHERRRLLVINRYFHPDECATSQLLTDLVTALPPDRFATTVITGRQHYVNATEALPARQCFGGAHVRRVWHTHFGRVAMPGRAIDCLTFAASTFLSLVTSARRGDLILAKTDPPLLSVVAWLAARLTGARLVNWCQDLFPETAAAMGFSFARSPLGHALRVMRNASLRGAELNVAVCEAMAARLVVEGVPQARVAVIHNWADGAAIRPMPAQGNPLRQAWGLDGKFVIGYSGNLGFAHEVDALVELMAALRDEPDLVFLFVGAGHGYRHLRVAAAERQIRNIVFRPYQPRRLLPQSLTAPDMHLVTLRPAFEGLMMPSKLYGALAAGRPVIFIGDPDGSVGRMVAPGLGLAAAPAGMAELASEIRVLRRNPARLARIGARARRAYETTWNKDASLAAWISCLRPAGQPAEASSTEAVAAE